MRLYYSPASPYARKVRATALRLGAPVELALVNPLDGHGDYQRINPLHRVPSLELENGEVLFDSCVICEYLDATFGPALFPASERWDALRRQALGDGIMDAAVPRRQEMMRPAEQQSSDRLGLYKRSVDHALDYLDARAQTLPHDDIGAIAIGCALQYLDFRFPDEHWAEARAALSHWYSQQISLDFMSVPHTAP